MNQNNNKIENRLFKINNHNFGRKKKGSGQIGKHKKTYADNMLRIIKSFTFNKIMDIINDELKNIKYNEFKILFHLNYYKSKENKQKIPLKFII